MIELVRTIIASALEYTDGGRTRMMRVDPKFHDWVHGLVNRVDDNNGCSLGIGPVNSAAKRPSGPKVDSAFGQTL